MRDDRDLFERRQFWPRPGRPEALGEIDFDQPCANCGYNLRGLPPNSPCPECGSRGGLNLSEDPVPWEARQSIISLIETLYLTLIHPHELAAQVWRPARLDLVAARKFRRIALFVATPTLCAIAYALTAAATDAVTALACLPFNLAAIVIWLNAATLEPARMFRNYISFRMLKRVEVISHYASAPLLLVPLHLGLLPVTFQTAQAPETGWLIATGMHLGALFVTMALGTLGTAWLLYETVDVPKLGALTFTLAAALSPVATGVVMLLGVPAFAASVVWRALGN